jgi:hypothetical protein
MTASGFAGVLGLFAGLCVILAGCVTLVDWHDEITQARWPVVSATVDRADVVAATRAPKGDAATRMEASHPRALSRTARRWIAALTSRAAFSEADAAKLQAWAARHRKGSHVDIRVDPSRDNRLAFAAAEISSVAARMRTDLLLLAIAAGACAGLLALAKYLGAREARAAPALDGAAGVGLALGLAVAAMGLMLIGFAVYAAVRADPFTADNLMGVPAGLMFVFSGILLTLPPQYEKWRSLLATLVMTCFALTFDWVAFGPGEREFGASIMGFGFIAGEYVGRALFGAFAVVLDICAITMWIGEYRRAFGPSMAPTISTI